MGAHHRGRYANRVVVLAALVAALAAPAAAQRIPARPRLDAGADTNDWNIYYDSAVAQLKMRYPDRADASFYWAARLEPTRAEPLYGRFVAYFMRNPRRLEQYLQDDRKLETQPEYQRADSLFHQALLRNPLVFQGLFVLAVDQLGGEWGDDPVTVAWLDYAALRFQKATETWG